MKLVLSVWAVCLLALVHPTLGLAGGVEPDITFEYYPVQYTKGLSVGDLITRDTPLSSPNGHRHAGVCSWRIKYDRNTFTRPTIGVCRVREPKVSCECVISIARLVGGDNDPDFQRRFSDSVEKTRAHELEHCNIAVLHANRLLATFSKLKDRKCEDQRQVMLDEYSKVRAACSSDQARFDHAEYKYRQHLQLEGLQRMVDAGFNVVPPAEGRFMPRLSRKPALKNLEVMVPEGTESLAEKGIYKDENGVWRNY